MQFRADLFRAVSLAVSSEETRYYLQGVFIHPLQDRPGVRLVATDGHRMLVAYDATAIPPSRPVTIRPTKALLTLAKTPVRRGLSDRDKRIVINAPDNEDHGGAAAGTASVICTSETTEEKLADLGSITAPDLFVGGTYPDYMRAIPRVADPSEVPGRTVGFNAGYLGDFGKVCEAFGSKVRAISLIQTTDAGGPHLVRFGCSDDLFGVIMPVRGAKDTFPDWWSAPAGKLSVPNVNDA